MNNVIAFVERAPDAAPRATIEARRFMDHFRYDVRAEGGTCPFQGLDTSDLTEAREAASYWGKKVVEAGPAEAFGGPAHVSP